MKLTPSQQKILDFLKSHPNMRIMKKFSVRISEQPTHYTSNIYFEEIEGISSATFNSLLNKSIITADFNKFGVGSKHLFKLNPKLTSL